MMSKSDDFNNFYKVDWSKVTYTVDLSNSYRRGEFISFNEGGDYYDRLDAEFDALEDQTSIAKEMLNNIGIKC